MKTFFTSDQHFMHKNVIEYDTRPFADIDEMTEGMINQWNSVVNTDDIVWMLGDLYLGNKYDVIAPIVARLHGRKRLIYGNHDRFKPEQYKEMGFEFVSKYPVILKQHFILSHAPFPNFRDDKNFYYIYGHVHTAPEFANQTSNSTCVCCNRYDFKPIIIKEFDKY